MKDRNEFLGACALAGAIIFVFGLLAGLWHVERGPGDAGGPVAGAPAPVSSAPPTPKAPGEPMPGGEVRLGTAILVPRPAARADLFIESGTPASATELIAAAVDADVDQVQRSYGRRFAARPQVYVFSSRASYNRGVEVILGAEQPTTATMEAAGVALGRRGLIAVDWAELARESPVTSFRHELTHVMIAQIARPSAENPVPRWLNEGSARLEEFTLAGTEWQRIQHRAAAASFIANGHYFPLQSLRSDEDWGNRTGLPATRAYYESAAAVELLRRDIGAAGVIRILDLMGQGQQFEAAFLEVVGEAATRFEDSALARISASSPLPGVVTLMDGDLLRVVLYGFKAGAEVAFDVLGKSTKLRNTDHKVVTVDENGIWTTSLGPGWPSDNYTITATGARANSDGSERVAVTVSAAWVE